MTERLASLLRSLAQRLHPCVLVAVPEDVLRTLHEDSSRYAIVTWTVVAPDVRTVFEQREPDGVH